MIIDIRVTHNAWSKLIKKGDIRSFLKKALQHVPNAATGQIDILLSNDAEIKELNRQFRGKDKPTNVLSFPSTPPYLGSLALAYETCEKEAQQIGFSFSHYAYHLLLHGFLHLQGYDHLNDEEGDRMESLETFILSQCDIPSPYGSFELGNRP